MTTTHTDHAAQMQAGMKLYLFPHYTRFRRKTVDTAALAPGDAVLDFGCGVGLLEEFILPALSAGGKVIGVDIGKELIDIARARFPSTGSCEFAVIDASGRLPFAGHSFDVVVSNLVFHLLTPDQKHTVLAEFLRVLKPGGRLVMGEIGRPSGAYGWWIKFLTLRVWVRTWPYVINSIDSFEGRLPGILRNAGFNDVRVTGRMRGYIDFISCSK